MTATTAAHPRTASVPRTAILLAAAIAVASAANAVVALAAVAAGATMPFGPLQPGAYITFTVVGVLAGYAGWSVVRRLVPQPARLLRVLVPVVLVLSWIPDVIVAIAGFIPNTSATGAVGLALMHAVVVAVAVPVYQRIAPVG
ncbi:MAG TPA: DUF6069 family protein [Rhodoglobus sp.]|nr:DUF6069 family protein [Rhodoglobus sp.]